MAPRACVIRTACREKPYRRIPVRWSVAQLTCHLYSLPRVKTTSGIWRLLGSHGPNHAVLLAPGDRRAAYVRSRTFRPKNRTACERP